MNKHKLLRRWAWALGALLAVVAWQVLPDRYMGPYGAWNPHAIMEFVITLFVISLAVQWAMQVLGAHDGLLFTGLMGGFASSTATIHSMGRVAKLQPTLAGRAALGGVLSHLATLVQLAVLLQLLAPSLMPLWLQPMCFGMVGMGAYALWVLLSTPKAAGAVAAPSTATSLDWQSLLTLTALVCGVSYAASALNANYGANGLWWGAAVSGLVDAHAMVPTVASLLSHQQLQTDDALLPLLMALSANTLTKSLVAFQSGGWVYASNVTAGMCCTTAAVWVGYLVERPVV